MKRSSWLLVPAVVCVPALGFAQAPAPTPPAPSNLESGGLRPPEPIGNSPEQPDPTAEQPARELERADREDSGRGLEWVWLNAEVGGQHLGLGTLKQSSLVDAQAVKTTQTGLVVGAGAGVRLLVFTIGARFRLGDFSDWRLWTLGLEGGLRIPIGSFEPYTTLGVGYASIGSFSSSLDDAKRARVKGLDARLGAGFDYYLSNTFSVGANLSGDLLFLSRSAVSGGTSAYLKDGSSIGLGVTLTAVAGLHF